MIPFKKQRLPFQEHLHLEKKSVSITKCSSRKSKFYLKQFFINPLLYELFDGTVVNEAPCILNVRKAYFVYYSYLYKLYAIY